MSKYQLWVPRMEGLRWSGRDEEMEGGKEEGRMGKGGREGRRIERGREEVARGGIEIQAQAYNANQ